MKKILHINTIADPRSGVGQIIHAIRRLADNSALLHSIVAGYGNHCHADFTLQGKWTYRFNAFRSRLNSEDGFLGYKVGKKLTEIIREFNPDLVHLHNLHGYYTDIVSLLNTLKKSQIPYIITLHDLWLTTGRCAHPPGGDCISLRNSSCKHCPYPRRYPAKWLSGESMLSHKMSLLANASAVVVPSHWMADRVPSKYKPIVIPNGVDLNIFQPNLNVYKKPRLIAIATKWTNAKGIKDLKKLADYLPAHLDLALVGRCIPSHPRILNLGYINDASQLSKLIGESLCVVSASHEESFGLTVAESLAIHTPVIARIGTAPAEMIPDSRFSVDFNNPEKVLAAIDYIPHYTFPESSLDIKDTVNKYQNLYRSLMNRKYT